MPSMEDLHRWRGRQGPKLRALLAAQENQHPPVRRVPSLIHVWKTQLHCSRLITFKSLKSTWQIPTKCQATCICGPAGLPQSDRFIPCVCVELVDICSILHRESYSLEHFRRLRRFEARADFQTRDKVRCIDVHSRNDARCVDCKTCHFCRRGILLYLTVLVGPLNCQWTCPTQFLDFADCCACTWPFHGWLNKSHPCRIMWMTVIGQQSCPEFRGLWRQIAP